ncbi:putative Dynamin-type G domain-containing protein [uncultured Gammaproteobacteria bacterium]
MQESSIRSARDEVLGLLRRQRDLLVRIEAAPVLLKQGRVDGVARTLDVETARAWRGNLDHECTMVERLEMVLAVVGTMKAGKSTTINAIVGTEVLPNRNQPMTTLPTLIRHRPGQTIPVMLVPKPAPLIKMAVDVRAALERARGRPGLRAIGLYNEPDGRGLIEDLLSSDPQRLFLNRYEGQAKIFAFLKNLNDLMRLARDPAIDIEPPFDEFNGVAELPVIEVEFYHLRQTAAVREGNFALLDTPGPNESGQSGRLRKILKDQLARASAVLAVLDYTQLKSEAEEDVRNDLAEIAEQTEDRLFVLVNKFDQKDRNSMNAEETRDHIAKGLMNGRVDAARIFPASSRNGYLANRARQELERGGRLPDPMVHDWVVDFAKLGLGISWKRELNNPAVVRAAADDLWASSHFDAPIRHVVVKAAAQAAMIAMKSALAKMGDQGRKIDTFLELRRGSLGQDVREAQALITGLERDIGGIEAAQVEARKGVFEITALYSHVVDSIQSEVKAALRGNLTRFFKTGINDPSIRAAEYQRALVQSHQRLTLVNGRHTTIFEPVFAVDDGASDTTTPHRAATRLFDPASPIIRCDGEAAARKLAALISREVEIQVREALALLETKLSESAQALERGVGKALHQSVGWVLEKAHSRLKTQGFHLNIKFPDPKLDAIGGQLGDLGSVAISQQTLIKKGRRETQSLLGQIGRWWKGDASDWGYEIRTYQETLYQVDIDKVSAKVLSLFDSEGLGLHADSKGFVGRVIEPILIGYFTELKQYLESFRGILLDGIEDHRYKQKQLDELRRVIGGIVTEAGSHGRDVTVLKEKLDALPVAALEDPLPPEPEPEPEPEPKAIPATARDEARKREFTGDETIVPDVDATFIGADIEATMIGTLLSKPKDTLELHYNDKIITLSLLGGKLLLGRGSDCNLVVTGRRSSRHHAEISYQNGIFMLVDSSTNGTFLQFDGSTEMRTINRTSELLRNTGKIGLGMEPGNDREHTIVFKVVHPGGR